MNGNLVRTPRPAQPGAARPRRRMAGFRLPALIALAAALLLAGHGARAGGGSGAPLTVAAAASLQPLMRELGPAFRARERGEVTFVIGASGNLAQQLEHGAPYDLFLSADEGWVEGLAAKGVLDPATVRPYARGRLALVFATSVTPPKGMEVAGTGELAMLDTVAVRNIALANPAHAPYGKAAREALQAAGLWEWVRPKLVYGENVRQALTFVQTGNADAGLVAESIVRGGPLRWLPVAEALHAPLRQALGIRRGSIRRARAGRFVAFMQSPEGRAALRRYGLVPLPQRQGGRP